nr:hypothetical protein [Phocaeicola massiliensis]
MNRQVCIVGYHYSLNKGGCMGTLGCINDMMRRDKENRELRRASRERLNETRNRLLDVKGKRSECNVSYEQLEHIAHETREWEEKERNSFLKGKLVFITLLAGIVLLMGTVLALFCK